jgi:(2Fe-2S) ferredoxin
MSIFEKHVFVCVNERPEGHPRGCCAAKNSSEVRDRMKLAALKAGLRGRVRVNASGCLDQCEDGVTVVVYPEGTWYGGVTVDDADEIVSEHLVGGKPVKRLILDRSGGDG